MNAMNSEQVEIVNEFVRKEPHFEFQVYSFSPRKLVIGGAWELDYFHQIELEFENVWFFSGCQRIDIADPQKVALRLVTDEQEIKKMKDGFDWGANDSIFVFESSERPLIVVADKLTVREQTVFYYKREDLKANEEVAYWLK